MNIFQSIAVLQNPAILSDAVKQVSDMQQSNSPVSSAFMLRIMKAVVWFLLFYAVVLGVHISFTFRYLKQYAHLFGEKNNNNPVGDSF